MHTLNEDDHISNPYIVPENYFNTLEQRIIDQIGQEHFFDLPDVTQDATFRAPAGYFNKLETSISYKIGQGKATKRRILSWYKVAAAAIITGIIAFSALRLLNNNTHSQLAEKTMSASDIQKVNSSELAEFAEVGEENLAGTTVGKKSIDANQLFKGVSNQELQNFLNENAANDSDLF
ncbi:hypothetical protein [Niabella ginsengisoli]|uniref:Uncharacterized protein n=1 Tax=Niabella ginsengisoli TaxID=522298 RepID=A0ABS9SQB6_9BACT|nr:hypothetical protein [Niabella ginsengisoli]MCH5600588.1 hypothetical protein [Niabella ginsengisoli]